MKTPVLRSVVGLAVFLLATTLALHEADAIPLTEQLLNGNFSSSISGWTPSGDVSVRLSTDSINTSGGNAGFNSFFSSSFLVLGDTADSIAGIEDSNTSSISQTFVLPQGTRTYDLTISFKSVFDGDDRDNINQVDLFTVFLNSTQLLFQTSFSLPNCDPTIACPDNQLVQNPLNTSFFNLPGGSYTLTFQLAENNNAQTNTAVGIDDISVIGQSNISAIAAVPEPSSFLLMGLGLVGLAAYLKRRSSPPL